jgi:hypothetical protein
MSKLKCFVACAFDNENVDEFYDGVIFPELDKMGIEVIRIDRYIHNDHIDKKIIELIRKCDFGIADLTFARPSVYYEAGFLEGLGKQVIYSCERSHFKARIDDEHGNLKVHFDLSTKNIIGWSQISPKLKTQFKDRVMYIIKPLLEDREFEEKILSARKEFKKLALSTMRKRVEASSISILSSNKIELVKNGRGYVNYNGTIKLKRKEYISAVTSQKGLTLNELRDFLPGNIFWDEIKKNSITPISERNVLLIINSVKNITNNAIREAFPFCDLIDDENNIWKAELKNGKNFILMVTSKIESELEFEITFKKKLETLKKVK